MKHALVALTTLCASSLAAQEVVDCDWQARADAIVEPWEQNTRTFANGNVRLALLDTIEPAAGAYHILVMSPPFDELGGRQCKTVGVRGMGFAGVDFTALEAAYIPSVGLKFVMPIQYYFDASGANFKADLHMTLDQRDGAIKAWFE